MNKDHIWDEILKWKKLLSDKEAKELEENVRDIRKERGFRIV